MNKDIAGPLLAFPLRDRKCHSPYFMDLKIIKKYKRKILYLVVAAFFIAGTSTTVLADNNSPTNYQQKKADNTGINARDRNGAAPDPTDQSSTPEDTEITASIRRAVTKDESLSVNAKNVKIITANGQVTLRGPVDSGAEREKIVLMAKALSGGYPVINELEIANP